MHKTCFNYLIFLLLTMGHSLNGQQLPLEPWYFQNAYIPNTMPGSQSMTMDIFGRLWVATTEGIRYYDGARMHYLEGTDPLFSLLKDVSVTALYIDRGLHLWIGTFEHGLFRYHLTDQELMHYDADPLSPCALQDNRVMYIFEDVRRNIWISTHQKGISRYKEDGACPFVTFIPVENPDAMKDKSHFPNIVNVILQDENEPNVLWLGTMRGLWKYFIEEDCALPIYLTSDGLINGPEEANSIRSMIFNKSDGEIQIYMATWGGGVWAYRPTSGELNQYQSGNGVWNKNNFLLIQHWGERQFLLGATLGGLCFFSLEDKSFKWLDSDHLGYPVNSPSSMYSKDGVLWLTDGSNRHYFHDSNHHILSRHRVPAKEIIKTIYASTHQKYFSISSYSRCVYTHDGSENFRPKPHCIPKTEAANYEKFHDIVEAKDGEILVISNHNIYHYDPTKGLQPLIIKGLNLLNIPHTVFLRACVDHDNNLWIGTNWEGLIKVNLKSRELTVFKEGKGNQDLVHSFWISDLQVDDQNNIWYGTAKGFGYYSTKYQRFFNYPPPYSMRHKPYLSFERLATLYPTLSDTAVLLGSQSKGLGLGNLDSSGQVSIRPFTRDDGLRGDRIWQICSDGAGRYFLLTNKGISCFNSVDSSFTNIGVEYGLQHIGSIQWTDAGLLVGVRDGFYVLDMDKLPDSRRTIQPVLIRLEMSGQDIRYKKSPLEKIESRHPYTENFLSFEIGCDQLLYRELVRFSYKLEGLDSDWIDAGIDNSASYAGLSPGTYQLLTRVRLDGDSWSEAYELASIVITPPFYQRTWFILIMIALFLLALRLLHKFRTDTIRKEERLKSEFNSLVAASEMKALRAQMNPHFLFNCLNSIKVFMLENKVDAASKYMSKFARLIGLILENSEIPLISLERELEAIQLYIDLEKLRFSDSFSFKLEVDKNIQPAGVEIPPLLLQPYIENAIWHGLLPKEDNRNLWLKIHKINPSHMEITIEDDGIGRELARKHKVSSSRKMSMGTQITAKRIDLANSIHDLEADVTIEDLYPDSEKYKGTKVCIRLKI